MNRRAIVLFRGDPRREERQKGLPPRLLSALHAELERVINNTPGVDLIDASEVDGRFVLRSPEWISVSSAAEALSEKIDHSLRVAFDSGYESVVLLAGDVAGLTPDLITRAFDALNHERVVLGPSRDGGFYLAGFRRYIHIDWSSLQLYTANALAGLKAQLASLHVTWIEAKRLDDIDSREDAETIARRLRFSRLGRILIALLDRRVGWSMRSRQALPSFTRATPARAPPSL